MKTQLVVSYSPQLARRIIRPLLTATLAFAITLTLSCSSDDGSNEPSSGSVTAISSSSDGGGTDNSSSSGSNGQGVPFNENSQIYNGYYDEDDVYHIGAAYNGNGVIKILAYDEYDNETLINAGNVTNGIVNLNLPRTIPDKYLRAFFISAEDATHFCTEYTNDIKQFEGLFVLTDSNGDYEFVIHYEDESVFEVIEYWYFTKAGKITCNFEFGDDSYKRNKITNIDAKVGWNKIYCHSNYAEGKSISECSTNNILTKEMKWTINTQP